MRLMFALSAVIVLLLTACGNAQMMTPKGALERFFVEPLAQEHFTDEVLAQVSVEQLDEVKTQLTTQLGAYERVQGDESPFTAVFFGGTATAQISLDNEGRIAGLFFSDIAVEASSVEEAASSFADLPGQTSVFVLQDGEEVAALSADTPLAVGSTFKLAVLSALRDQIEAGTHAWDEVVSLEPEWTSLPSGILQTWPDNAPITLQTLATLMISQSDNTATDALIHIVARETVEAKTERNRPFLTTQEAFKLKDPANETLLERYLSGDEAEKRQVLRELEARSLPSADLFSSGPIAPEVEWFLTTRELCALMAQVQDLPLMSVNPGVANPERWARVAYKGGSEPGVLNLTTWLVTQEGQEVCVSATQVREDAVVDEATFSGLYGGLLEVLR